MQLTPKSLLAAIERDDDFAFEMAVSRNLHRLKSIRIHHGGTYSDPVERKPRQFDFRCELWDDATPDRAKFAIEVKNLSSESPLVISGIRRPSTDSRHQWIVSDCSLGILNAAVGICSSNSRIYPAGVFTGKSLGRYGIGPRNKSGGSDLLKTSDEDIYKRWSQALASAYDLCESSARVAAGSGIKYMRTAIIPVVVVPDGTLWKIEYTDEGQRLGFPEPSNLLEFYVNHSQTIAHPAIGAPMAFTFTHLHFVTLTGLTSLMAGFGETGAYWNTWIKT
jgi:hypothetical protein